MVEIQSDLIRIGDAAKKLGVHSDTLRYHARKGLFTPYRNGAGVRFITHDDFLKLIDYYSPKMRGAEVLCGRI